MKRFDFLLFLLKFINFCLKLVLCFAKCFFVILDFITKIFVTSRIINKL